MKGEVVSPYIDHSQPSDASDLIEKNSFDQPQLRTDEELYVKNPEGIESDRTIPMDVGDNIHAVALETPYVAPNKCLDGRPLSINFREQKLLRAVRDGKYSPDILDTVYKDFQSNTREIQMRKDADHIRELLMVNGYTLKLEKDELGTRFTEERRVHTPTTQKSRP